MSDATSKAYDAASRAAHAIVSDAVESIMDAIRTREITDEDGLSDRIHEEADNACIYTADQYALVWGLRDGEDAIEEGLTRANSWGYVLAAQAFCNVRAAINEYHDEFVEAIEAANKEAEAVE